MNKNQENKLSMYYVVRKVCTDNNSVWSGLTAYATAFGNFTANITALEAALEKQLQATTGYAKNKRATEEAMVDKAIEIAKAVFAYAKNQNDTVLQAKVNYSRSDLLRERDSVTMQLCQGVKDEAQPLVGALGPYGVTNTDLTQLQTLIDAFDAANPTPRAAITSRKRATDAISKLEKDIDDILKGVMDPLMENFKATQPDFYKLYFDARIIVDTGSRSSDDDASTPTPTSPAA
jgi:hypothetical protein